MKLTLISSALLVVGASAKLHTPSTHVDYVRRALPSDAAGYAKLDNPTKECKYYTPPEMEQMLKDRLPKAGKVADILPNDDEAKKVWKEIQDTGIIPEEVKTKPDASNGKHAEVDIKSANYDADKDPDCWWSASQCTKPKHNKIPEDIAVCPEGSTYGLTFDDGPNCSHNAFYDFLKQKKLKASLFYIGTNVATWPYQAQRGLADGHDICVHTWSHPAMTTLSDSQVFAELFYTVRVIKAVLGITTTCWRPPFGDTDDRVRAIAAGLGLRTIHWREDTDDWQMASTGSPKQVRQNYDKIVDKASNESPIVLAHELHNDTMSIFIEKESKIADAYKHVAPISACMNVTNPYMENQIVYPDFEEYTGGNANYKGLPDMSNMKINPNVDFSALSLAKMDTGFAPGGENKKQTDTGSATFSSDSSDDGSKNAKGSKDGGSGGKDNSHKENGAIQFSSLSLWAAVLSSITVTFVAFQV